MAYTDIDKPSDYFDTLLYSGTGSSNAITGLDFQPDWVSIKKRSAAGSGNVYDSVRGALKHISTNLTAAEETESSGAGLTTFGSNGFTVGTEPTGNGSVNQSSQTYVGWCWKAGGGAGSSNEDGSINTTSTSVNQTAGFSISTWTGTGSNATVGHGLGAVPKVIITKARSDAYDWYTYHASIGNTKNVYLNLTNAESDASTSFHNNTNPTSSVWTAGGGVYNVDYTFVTYAFAEKQGYSKFSSYVGNGNADGTFVYTGFKPACILIKRSSTAGNDWGLFDNKRLGFNVDNEELRPSAGDAEQTDDRLDILSNGFKIRLAGAGFNASGDTFIYMAFAENPFVTSTGVPATAR